MPFWAERTPSVPRCPMRQFLVIAAIAIGLACPACNDPLPKEKEPPQTTAGKLIGKWKLVRFSNGQPTSPELDSTIEYTKDGKVIIRSNDPKNGPWEEEGTYKVEGNTIHCHSEQRRKDRDWSVTIKEITHDNLVFADPYSNPDHGVEYKRIEVGEHK